MQGLSQNTTHSLDHLPLPIVRQVSPETSFYYDLLLRRPGRGGLRRLRALYMGILPRFHDAACGTIVPDLVTPKLQP
jgi:hypothetical protein